MNVHPAGAAAAPEVNRGRSGVVISDVTLRELDGVVHIGFDIAWNGSWRYCHDPTSFPAPDLEDLFKPPNESCDRNWDAAWVFVKHRVTEVLPLERSPKMIAVLVGGDGNALRSLALDQGLSKEVVEDWFGGRLTISPTQKGERRWSVMQERVSTSGTSGPEDRIVDNFEIVLDESEALPRFLARRQSRWKHATLSTANRDHHAPPGARIRCAENGAGVFIYRSEDNHGVGPVRFSGVELRWDIKPNEIEYMSQVSLWVFGIEMVYVPEGPFWLGDPLGPKGPENCFYDALRSGGDLSYEVTSEEPIEVGKREGPLQRGKRLYYSDSESVAGKGDQEGPVPREFPKGFRAFYVMKRQITQGQYADFINTLQGSARTARFPYWTGDYRYAIFWGKSGDRVAMRPERACNWLSWLDGISYAAWAGLRPMTELEYEKSCRGPLKAVSGEYAWGDTVIQQAQVIVGPEDGTETVNGNASFENFTFLGGDGDNGPLRDDAFGTPGSAGASELFPSSRKAFWKTQGKEEDGFQPVPPNLRRQTGASYFGVMGLSGNLWELCVTVGKEDGRRFSGLHGRGVLTIYGAPDCKELGWPGEDAEGVGFRGGSWYTARNALRVADRTYASGLIGWYSNRSHDLGFRCAHTAPED